VLSRCDRRRESTAAASGAGEGAGVNGVRASAMLNGMGALELGIRV
jgi:hypothetical protein